MPIDTEPKRRKLLPEFRQFGGGMLIFFILLIILDFLLLLGPRHPQMFVDRPDKIGRRAILAVHSRKVKLAEDVDLDKLAARTPGFAGADLANLVNESALLAARHNRESVTMADLNEAIERVLTGLEKKSRVLNDLEKKTIAYHESGHAILGTLPIATDL